MNNSNSDPSLTSHLGSLPVFLSSDPYLQQHHDPSSSRTSEDSRLSFPASVHTNYGGRGSYAAGNSSSVGDLMLDRSADSSSSAQRSPPPPVPPKPPPKFSANVEGPTNQPWPSNQLEQRGYQPSHSGQGGLVAPQPSNARRPSEVLDLSIFAEQSPPAQHQSTFQSSRASPQPSNSPFPSGASPSAHRSPSPSRFPNRLQTPSPAPSAASASSSQPFASTAVKRPAPGIPPRPQSTDPFPSFQLKTTPSSSSSNLPQLALNDHHHQQQHGGSPSLPSPPIEQLSNSFSAVSLSSASSGGSALPPPPSHHARGEPQQQQQQPTKSSSGSSKLKDRLAAGVALGQSWAAQAAKSKHAAKLQQSLADSGLVGNITTNPLQSATSPNPSNAHSHSSSSLGPAPSGSDIKLPATILGIRVPKQSGACFSRELQLAVYSTRVPPPRDGLGLVRSSRERNDEVTGDEARDWLPGIAFRCLQFLEEWGRTEEGVYRVPGRSVLINQLRALYDAGCDLDLREMHPADLDPHAVASLFKSWLRDIPESLLSPALEATIDNLSLAAIGFTASSASFMAAKPAPGGPAGLVDGRAPRQYLEQLREAFTREMPAEHFVLLRAIAYHFARLSSCSGTNKMTLNNFRLILSPTLRLSPVFLQILVEEREILFSGRNESIRQREGSWSASTFAEGASGRSPQLGGTGSGKTSPRMGHSASGSIYSSPVGSPLLGAGSGGAGAGSTLTPPVSNPTSPHLSNSPRSSPRLGAPTTYRKPPPSILPSLPSTGSTLDPNSLSPHLAGQESEWLVISDENGSRTPPVEGGSFSPSIVAPHSPASSTGSRRTPIADRFASTFVSGTGEGAGEGESNRLSPSAASIASFSSSGHNEQQPPVPVKPYVPSRGAPNPIGFYAKRDEPPAVIRKNSGGSAKESSSAPGKNASAASSNGGGSLDPSAANTLQRPAQGRERTASGSSSGSLGSTTSRGRRVAVVSQMFRDGAEHETEQDEDAAEQLAANSPAPATHPPPPRVSSAEPSPSTNRGRFYSESTAAGDSPSFASLYGGSAARQSVDSTYSEADSVLEEEATLGVRTRVSIPPPSLAMPVGLGMGLGEGGKGGEEDDWGGLLSVQERKRLWEGK